MGGMEPFLVMVMCGLLRNTPNFTKLFSFTSSLLYKLVISIVNTVLIEILTHNFHFLPYTTYIFHSFLPIMTTSTTQYSITEERALKLLGSGIGPEVVASACGVSASRISQLLAEPEFLGKVAELRFNNLQKHNETDATYDDIETKLLGHLKQVLPLIAMKPNELLRAISVINAAKRRGV